MPHQPDNSLMSQYVNVVVTEGAAAVSNIPAVLSNNISCTRYVLAQLNSTQCVDIIWDVYKSGSLKEHARYRSGNYIRVFVVVWSSTWLCQKYGIASFSVTRKKGVIRILEPCVGGSTQASRSSAHSTTQWDSHTTKHCGFVSLHA